MNKVSGNPIPTDKIVSRLRLMAGAGGMLTRDRLITCTLAADRLEELEERIAIMTEQENAGNVSKIDFPIYGGRKT